MAGRNEHPQKPGTTKNLQRGEVPVEPAAESVLCSSCRTETWHQAIWSQHNEDYDEDWEVCAGSKYEVMRCLGCDSVTYRIKEWNCDVIDPESGDMATIVRLYPPRTQGISTLREEALAWVPFQLWRLHTEIVSALHVQAGILAAIGMRAIVEGVCLDRGANGRSFASKVRRLADLGLIPNSHVPVLLLLRDYGNKAAHELREPSARELKTLFELVDQLLNSTYMVPHAAGTLRMTRVLEDHPTND